MVVNVIVPNMFMIVPKGDSSCFIAISIRPIVLELNKIHKTRIHNTYD